LVRQPFWPQERLYDSSREDRVFRRLFVLIALGLSAAAPPVDQDRALVGAWKAVTYEVNGVQHPMQGLFIFTKSYYSANVRFKLGNSPMDDANGNAGPYTRVGNRIVFKQWVQVHVRPGDSNQPILSREGPDESSDYQFDGDRLILVFPSKNRYILERMAG
jgi:hypothetical protein